MTARTKARRRAVDVIFEADQTGRYGGDGLRALLQERLAVTAAQTALPQYSADIVAGLAEHSFGIDHVLATYLQGWTLDRLPAVDRAILRAATWELLYGEEVDGPVVITEAITLAEDLSTDDSPRFVNAVLDRLKTIAPVLTGEIEVEEEAEARRVEQARRRAEEEAARREAEEAERAERRARWEAEEAERQAQWEAQEAEREARQAEWESREAQREAREEQWEARQAEAAVTDPSADTPEEA